MNLTEESRLYLPILVLANLVNFSSEAYIKHLHSMNITSAHSANTESGIYNDSILLESTNRKSTGVFTVLKNSSSELRMDLLIESQAIIGAYPAYLRNNQKNYIFSNFLLKAKGEINTQGQALSTYHFSSTYYGAL